MNGTEDVLARCMPEAGPDAGAPVRSSWVSPPADRNPFPRFRLFGWPRRRTESRGA